MTKNGWIREYKKDNKGILKLTDVLYKNGKMINRHIVKESLPVQIQNKDQKLFDDTVTELQDLTNKIKESLLQGESDEKLSILVNKWEKDRKLLRKFELMDSYPGEQVYHIDNINIYTPEIKNTVDILDSALYNDVPELTKMIFWEEGRADRGTEYYGLDNLKKAKEMRIEINKIRRKNKLDKEIKIKFGD